MTISLPTDWSDWPAIQYRLRGGRNAVITTLAFIAVIIPILWSGLLVTVAGFGRLLLHVSRLLTAAGEVLQEAEAPANRDPDQVPDRVVIHAIEHLELVDDSTNPDELGGGYVVAMPSCPLPEKSHATLHERPQRQTSRKRSPGAGRKTSARRGFQSGTRSDA
jgi:hypothetical protein